MAPVESSRARARNFTFGVPSVPKPEKRGSWDANFRLLIHMRDIFSIRVRVENRRPKRPKIERWWLPPALQRSCGDDPDVEESPGCCRP